MDQLLELQNYLASVRDDLKKNNLNSFESNFNTAIGILMDYRISKYHLTKRSIDKLIHYAGVLNLILFEARAIAEVINKSVTNSEKNQLDSEQLEKQLANLAFRIGIMSINNPQMNNDLDFLKTLYNRQLDENLNQLKERNQS